MVIPDKEVCSFDSDILKEVRNNRMMLREEYGSMDAYHTHIKELEAQLRANGVKFADKRDARIPV